MINQKQVILTTSVYNGYRQRKKEFLVFSEVEVREWARYALHVFFETHDICSELQIAMLSCDSIVKPYEGLDEVARAERFERFIGEAFQRIKNNNVSTFAAGEVTSAQEAYVYEFYRDHVGSFAKHYKKRRVVSDVFDEIVVGGEIKFRVRDSNVQLLHRQNMAYKVRKAWGTRAEVHIAILCHDRLARAKASLTFDELDEAIKEENQKLFVIDGLNKSGVVKGATGSRLQRAICNFLLNKKEEGQ